MPYLALTAEGGFTLAPRTRHIQRKSIHSLSTAVLLAALVAGGACAGGEEGTTPSGDRVLSAVPDEIKVNPNDTGTARFVLTSGGVPIAGQHVTFSIVDNPAIPDVEARGATLVDSSATTDGAGVAAVDVRAGLAAQFHIRATAGAAQADLMVFVVAGPVGNILVEPSFSTDSSAAARATGIRISFVDSRRCADLVLAALPNDRRDDKPLPASGGTAGYDFISTSGSHAVVGVARDAENVPVAEGCVDLPGSSLLPGGVVEVQLLLRDVVPNPVGRFAINSTFTFAPPLAAAANIAGPWRDLGDCPLDPAQLFLDCTIDALSPPTLEDPLDCKPSAVAGGEGVLGDALTARRGIPIADGAGAPTGCRAARDMSGAPSLEAIAMGLYGSPTPPLVIALPAIGNDAAHLLDRFNLLSTLDVASAGRPDEYVATHTLVGAVFTSPAAPAGAEVSIAALALPATTAYTTAITRDGLLVVDSHGFSLRLGQVARLGFGAAALEPRGVAGDAGSLITALAGLARSGDGAASGCAAFDRVLCAAVGRASGCLAAACPAGLSTLATVLDSAFDAADGTGLDLYLAGSAPLIGQGDGSAYGLGAIQGDPTAIASWSVDLRTAAGRARTTATWDGVRN
jgi:hypothetical protein